MIDRNGLLKNSPLIYALASVRFASWPLIANKIPEIHNELRRITPILHNIEVQQVDANKKEQTSYSWMMLSKEREIGIIMSADQLLVFTSQYRRYEDFKSKLSSALDALFKYMQFIDLTNIGIRYIDCISKQSNEEFSDYLTNKLLPEPVAGLPVIGGVTMNTYKLQDAELRVRCITQPDQMSIPADIFSLLSIAANMSLKVERLDGKKLLLDIDALKRYSSPEHVEDKNKILEILFDLHTKSNTFFRHEDVCKDHAFKIWKGEAAQ